MGWTFTNRQKGKSLKQFFSEEFDYAYGKVLDCAVKNNVAYIAYEYIPWKKQNPLTDEMITLGTKKVTGIVCLLQYRKNDNCNQGYKDMDITMGPNASDCPERILKLISPTTDGYAKDWLDRAWEHVNKAKNMLKLTIGMTIEFDEPIKFTNGISAKIFQVKSLKPRRFCDPIYKMAVYRITRPYFNSHNYRVVNA